MIGNDVVDLRHPDCRAGARHPRWDARVFGAAERDLIRRSSSPDHMRWKLWSAKEAAFKVLRRMDPAIGFLSGNIQVDAVEESRAMVRAPGQALALRWIETDDYVHALAIPDTLVSHCVIGIALKGDGDESSAVRNLAMTALDESTGLQGPWRIHRGADRIPWGRCRSGRSLPLSFSHHGRFVACAFAIPGDHS
ncbi:MAG: 4-phosphopantetheinyl transferase family protein [Planctomycetes bacterium]|nr:4-phosphopantetheinyl transferase family protein [Planctomycetota bacterium]